MYPWSTVLAVRGLPTIQERYEEQVENTNQLNSLTNPSKVRREVYTTEDYLQSICQLASPTFTVPELRILTLKPLDPLKRNPWLPRVPRSPRLKDRAVEKNGHQDGTNMLLNTSEPEISNVDSEQSESAASPLEYIYRNDDVLLSISQDHQCSGRGEEPSRCPRCVRGTCSPSSVPNLWSLHSGSLTNDLSSARLQQQPLPAQQQEPLKNKQPSLRSHGETDGSTGSRREMFGARVDKNSAISRWTEGCTSAWKEARVQACVLPAIAEV
ncbi:hypothetical protein Z043_124610 [Scleropages formosus]|uniref:Uncharacterized protein n=1 Tax=Scleropages formosus TaxID=113540 RepID=A0A0P7TJF7_SCLFO|nr:hypothetical protein Z043_124610 [Scleropages formosus]